MPAQETVRRWFQTADEMLLHENVEWTVPGYPVPQDTYRGRTAVMKEFFPALRANFSEWSAEIDEFIEAADGHNVTVCGRYLGKTLENEPVEIPFIHVWTVDDGRIVRAVAAANTALFTATSN